ncbi:MAG: CHRD domain-containing protein [Sphingobacteriales bacterium]|nr:MAG: CHRD domain-containing protein [Sphingobacteriales bacterium]
MGQITYKYFSMKSKAHLLLAASFFLCTLIACDKDDDDDKVNNNIITKTGLAVTGAQEVPVKTSPASGTLDVSYDKSTKMLSFTVVYQSLTAAPSGAHIHGPAAKGANAGIKYDFFAIFPKTQAGTFSDKVLVDGIKLKEDSLLAGFYYVNIHTSTNPGGEIRGQIEW